MAMTVHNENSKNKKQSLKITFDNVQYQTRKLIRTCTVMTGICKKGLPESADINIRLYYCDDVPEDYQAPGYRRVDSGVDHLEVTLSEALQLGCVESPYHKTVVKSYMRTITPGYTFEDHRSLQISSNSTSPLIPMNDDDESEDSLDFDDMLRSFH